MILTLLGNGRIVLGLTDENIHRLVEGHPIDCSGLGPMAMMMPLFSVVICHGKSRVDILSDLVKNGIEVPAEAMAQAAAADSEE